MNERLDRYREENLFYVQLPPAKRVVTINLEATKSGGAYLQISLDSTTPDGAVLDKAEINDAGPVGVLRRRVEVGGSEMRVRVAFGGMTEAATYTLTVE